MFLLPSLTGLLTYLIIRPQEAFESTRGLPLAAVLVVVAFSYLLDVGAGTIRLRGSPLTVIATAFFAWSLFTVAATSASTLFEVLPPLTTAWIAFVALSQGVQSFRAFAVATGALAVLTLLVGAVGVHQGLSPMECVFDEVHGVRDDAIDGAAILGRPCAAREGCTEPGVSSDQYTCEHVGVLHTHSTNERVRYLGLLEDPNELAWAVTCALPFAIAWFERRRSLRRFVVTAIAVLLGTVCVILTQSRGGQLCLAALVAVYFIRRYGWRGAALAAVVALPVLILGGRAGAEDSTQERLECWSKALDLFRGHPAIGVGAGQFTEYHYLTAHNSFLLAVAELGPIGYWLFMLTLYTAIKIVVQIHRQFGHEPASAITANWATAMAAALTGTVVSAFFLSLTYHPLLWIVIGLTGAFYGAVRAHAPGWRVRLGWRDYAFVTTVSAGLLFVLWLYLKVKGV